MPRAAALRMPIPITFHVKQSTWAALDLIALQRGEDIESMFANLAERLADQQSADQDISQLVALGWTDAQIAARLGMTNARVAAKRRRLRLNANRKPRA